jgi:hypothetical protein
LGREETIGSVGHDGSCAILAGKGYPFFNAAIFIAIHLGQLSLVSEKKSGQATLRKTVKWF